MADHLLTGTYFMIAMHFQKPIYLANERGVSMLLVVFSNYSHISWKRDCNPDEKWQMSMQHLSLQFDGVRVNLFAYFFYSENVKNLSSFS